MRNQEQEAEAVSSKEVLHVLPVQSGSGSSSFAYCFFRPASRIVRGFRFQPTVFRQI